MKRTWKDACCEVAWNGAKNKIFWNPDLFLNGESAIKYAPSILPALGPNPIRVNPNAIESDIESKKYNDFRWTFMRWLDENERKK